MSLADYTSVKTAVAVDWMHRSDLTSQADDFMDLFESDFNSNMRVRQMEQQTSIAATAGYLLHPTNWLGWKRLTCTNGADVYNLIPLPDDVASDLTYGESGGALPRYYKTTGTKTYLYPRNSAATIATTYYEGLALTGGTNWLLTSYPGAYLYGMLLQAVAFVGDDPRVNLWNAAYMQTLDKIRQESQKSSYGGQPLRMNSDVRAV